MNIIDKKFFDIHSHVIAGIDDGAQSAADSLTMLKQACDSGTRYIAATPHVIWNEHQPQWTVICEECKKLNGYLKSAGINITVVSGAEVALTPELLDEIKPGEYCLNSGKYMLVELPMLQMPQYAEKVIFGLQTKGIRLIMAHPERYPEVVKNPEIVLDWLHKGLLLQVNSKSITGLFGPEIQKCVLMLLENQVVSFVASDAHSIRGRNTKLLSAYEEVAVKFGAEYAEQIFITNSRAVFKSENVVVTKPERLILPRQKGFFYKFFGR
ncbi:MAG: CpsB/CapC family capsule biosynthesis tyrosine phosphatase [Negativicutes bacterium]|jgi:protein-tyrosine phosphatase